MGLLPGRDLIDVLERDADVVEPLEEAATVKWIHGEVAVEAGIVVDRACCQIDMQLIEVSGGVRRGGTAKEVVDILLLESDREHAVLEAVGVEDVGEGGGDDDAEAVVGQRPGGMLTARTAAEVAAGQQDRGSRR